MVAIFTGAGAGLLRSSANILGGAGQLGGAAMGQGGESVSVNAATGNLVISRRDEFLVGRGPDAVIARTFNSLADTNDRDNLDGWHHSTTKRVFGLAGTLNTAGSTIKQLAADGSVITYAWGTRNGLSAYWNSDGKGTYDRLVASGADWVWTDGDSRFTETYSASAVTAGEYRITIERRDIDTNKLTFSYLAGTDKLDKVTTQNGEWLQYTWSGNDITQVTTGYLNEFGMTSETRTWYDYSGGRLSRVRTDLSPGDNVKPTTDSEQSYWTEYDYDAAGRVKEIRQTDGSQIIIAYDLAGRVSSITQKVDAIYSRTTSLTYGATYTLVTAPDGKVTRLDFTSRNLAPTNMWEWSSNNAYVTKEQAGAIAGEAAVSYTVAQDSILSVVSSGANAVVAGDTLTFTIDLMAVPLWATTQDLGIYGSVSGWGTDVVTARIVSGPGSITTTGNALRTVSGLSTTEVTRIEITRTFSQAENASANLYINRPGYGVGQKLIAANGSLVKNDPLDSSEQQLARITAPAPYSGAPLEVVDFTYNGNGDVLSVHRYGSGGTSPQDYGTTSYTYDERGNVELITDPTGRTVERFYDSNGLLLRERSYGSNTSSSSAERWVRYAYDGEGHVAFMVDADGRVTEYEYEGAGDVSRVRQYVEQRYTATVATDLTLAGMQAWRDALDRSTIQITRYLYDARKNVISERTYGVATSAGAESITDFEVYRYYTYDHRGNLLSRQDNGDLAATFVYDGMNRLVSSVDPKSASTGVMFTYGSVNTVVTTTAGYTVTNTYNQAGELIASTDSGKWSGTSTSNSDVIATTSDYQYDEMGRLRVFVDARGKRTYYVYDDLGRNTGKVSEDGHLVEYQYDQAGRLVGTGRYYNAVSAANCALLENRFNNLTIANIRPAAQATYDIWGWTVYDDAGRVVQTLGGKGALTVYSYDGAGNRIAATTFATAKGVSPYRSAPPLAPVSLPPAVAADITLRNFYDGSGRMIGTLDGEGYLTETVYDGAGQAVQSIAYAGATLESLRAGGTFNELKNSAGQNNPANRRVYSAFDGNGLLRFRVNGLGEVTSFEYDINGQVSKSTAHAITVSTSDYTYDSLLTLVTTSANDRSTVTTFDTSGRVATVTTPAGLVTTYSYDTKGNVIKVQMGTGVDARIVRNYYSDGGQLRFTVDGEGYVSRFDYDPEGNNILVRRFDKKITDTLVVTDSTTIEQIPGHTGLEFVDEITAYDNQGAFLFSVNGEGEKSEVAYRANGYLHASYGGRNTSDQTLAVSYNDAAGRTTSTVSASGQTASQLNGAEGEQTQTSYFYDVFGNTIEVIDPNGEDTDYKYDERGLLTEVIDAGGGTTKYEYNAFGQVVRAEDAEEGITWTYYDNLGRAVQVVDAMGYVTTTSYTSFGEIENVRRYKVPVTGASTTNRPAPAGASALTSFEYDNGGRLKKVTDAKLFVESYGYNVFGERTSFTAKSETQVIADGSNNTTTYIYDKRGLLISETLPVKSWNDAGTQIAATVTNTFVYDARGNRKIMTEASGLAELRVTQYIYDKANRLVRTILPSFQGYTREEVISYDARGNVTSITDAASGRTVFYYDDLGRKVVEISPVGTYTSYEYDKNGNVDRIRIFTDPEIVPLDGGSQEKAGTDVTPSGPVRETIFAYDALNRMTSSTVVLAGGYITGSFIGGVWTNTDTTALATYYEYDALGNVVKTTDPEGNVTYAWYDDLSRKTAQLDAGGYLTTWDYDAEGNVLTERRHANLFAGTVDLATQPLVAINTDHDRLTTYTYDDVGNRLSESRHNVAVHNGSGGTNSITATVAYLYNGLGQVVQKSEATLDNVFYTYDDGGRLIEEKRDSYESHQVGVQVTPEVDYFYNGNGDLVRSVAAGAGDAAARITRYGHEGGVLKWMTDAEGVKRDYLYDKAGRVTHADSLKRHDSSGAQTAAAEGTLYLYDAAGRVTQQWQASSDGTTWTDEGPRTYFEYNAFGDVIATKTGTVSTAQVQNRYDLAGRLWATNSGDGIWKYFGHDRNGNQTIAVTSAGVNLSGIVSTESYFRLDSFANATAISEVGVNATYTVYDDRNLAIQVFEEQRELSAATPSSLTTSRSYNAFGEVASETDAATATLTYTYNTMGRMIRSEGPTVSMTKEDGTSHWIKPSQDYYYDASGRLVAQRDANGTYASEGTSTNGTSKSANTGNLTRLELLKGTGYGGSEALVSKQIAADGGITRTSFDIHGGARKTDILVTGTEASGTWRTTSRTFDKLGRLTQQTSPGGLIDYFAYDELGQRTQHWNSQLGSGNKELTDYDALGRVISQRAFGGDITGIQYTWSNTYAAANTAYSNVGGWQQVTTMANGRTSTERSDVFGRATYKNDLGGHETSFFYDVAGRQTSSAMGGVTTSFGYYNTGQLASNSGPNGAATYEYDEVGNRTSEKLIKSGVTVKDQSASYDALGRLTDWTSATTATLPEAWKSLEYDANGNIRRSQEFSHNIDGYGDTTTAGLELDYWFRFDSMNRVVTDKGELSGAAGAAGTVIVRGYNGSQLTWLGRDIQYDLAGQRIASITTKETGGWQLVDPGPGGDDPLTPWEEPPGEGGNPDPTLVYVAREKWEERESYTYDLAGRLTQIRASQGQSITETQDGSGNWSYPAGPLPGAPVGGVLRSSFAYDALGRQTLQQDYNESGSSVVYSLNTYYNDKGQVIETNAATLKTDGETYTIITRNDYGVGTNYALGAVVLSLADTKVDGNDANILDNATKYTFAWYDGAVQASIQYDTSYDNNDDTLTEGIAQGQTLSGFTNDYSTTLTYNALGQLTSASVNDGLPKTVTFILDELGQTIRREETRPSGVYSYQMGSPHAVWYRFGGVEMGHVTNNGTDSVSAAHSIAERTNKVPEWTGSYRGGRPYSSPHEDFSYSYDPFNSYQQGSRAGTYTVRGGESLQQIASNLYGDASLWYKLAEANGLEANAGLVAGIQLRLPAGVHRTTHDASTFKPYDPTDAIGELSPTAPAPRRGNNCGVFGAILIAAIAIAVTMVTAGAAAAALAPAAATALGGGIAGGLGVIAAGATAGGLSAGALIGIGAASAAAGSIVSQGVGVVTGIQDKFSWKSVGLAALSGGVGAGLGGVNPLGSNVSAFANDVARGALGSAISQGIGTLTGLQDSFSWAGVAAAGVSAGVGGALGEDLKPLSGRGLTIGNMASHTAVGAASLIASAATRSAIEGSSFGRNVMAGLPDVIGQVLGRALVGSALGNNTRVTLRSIPRPENLLSGTPYETPLPLEQLSELPYRSTNAEDFNTHQHLMSNKINRYGQSLSAIQEFAVYGQVASSSLGIVADEDIVQIYNREAETNGETHFLIVTEDGHETDVFLAGTDEWRESTHQYFEELVENEYGNNILVGIARIQENLKISQHAQTSSTTEISIDNSIYMIFNDQVVSEVTDGINSGYIMFEGTSDNWFINNYDRGVFQPKHVLAHELYHVWQVGSGSDPALIGSRVIDRLSRVERIRYEEVEAVRYTNQVMWADGLREFRVEYAPNTLSSSPVDSYSDVESRMTDDGSTWDWLFGNSD